MKLLRSVRCPHNIQVHERYNLNRQNYRVSYDLTPQMKLLTKFYKPWEIHNLGDLREILHFKIQKKEEKNIFKVSLNYSLYPMKTTTSGSTDNLLPLTSQAPYPLLPSSHCYILSSTVTNFSYLLQESTLDHLPLHPPLHDLVCFSYQLQSIIHSLFMMSRTSAAFRLMHEKKSILYPQPPRISCFWHAGGKGGGTQTEVERDARPSTILTFTDKSDLSQLNFKINSEVRVVRRKSPPRPDRDWDKAEIKCFQRGAIKRRRSNV